MEKSGFQACRKNSDSVFQENHQGLCLSVRTGRGGVISPTAGCRLRKYLEFGRPFWDSDRPVYNTSVSMFCSSVWYCWWFRTPACTQWVGHLYPHYFLPGFSTIQTLVGSGISEPSTEFSEIWALPADFANVETSSCNFFFRCTKTLRFLTASEAWRGRGIATTNPCLQGAQVGNASWWEPAWGASLQKTSISSGPMMGFYYGHLFSDCHWYILGWYPHWLGRGGEINLSTLWLSCWKRSAF